MKTVEYAAYLPNQNDIILKIREDECAALFIKRETARKILREHCARFIPGIRFYMLQLESYLQDNNRIDWYSCLLGCNSREMYNEVIRYDATKKLFNGFDENNYKYLIEFVKDIILKQASLMHQIIVFDKAQDKFVGELFLHTLTSDAIESARKPAVTLCLQNHQAVVAFDIRE